MKTASSTRNTRWNSMWGCQHMRSVRKKCLQTGLQRSSSHRCGVVGRCSLLVVFKVDTPSAPLGKESSHTVSQRQRCLLNWWYAASVSHGWFGYICMQPALLCNLIKLLTQFNLFPHSYRVVVVWSVLWTIVLRCGGTHMCC